MATLHRRMALRIGFLGGVPPALGGAGMEVQMERTAAALEQLGHAVVRVERAPPEAEWDVLHAFGSEGNVQYFLDHWTRTRAPLVVTPVVVTSPGRSELALQAGSRWPAPATQAALRRRALRRADALIALTGYERAVLRRLLGRRARIVVVPNGATTVAPAPADSSPSGYALLLGAVSERKRQRPVVEALRGSGPVVVAGGYAGTPGERARWEAAVAAADARWLGHVDDPARIARLLADAAALVHLSSAEGQSLAVVEALAHRTPVLVSDIPSHRELAAAHPGWVHVIRRLADLPAALERVRRSPPSGAPPRVPAWTDVAARLASVYADVVS